MPTAGEVKVFRCKGCQRTTAFGIDGEIEPCGQCGGTNWSCEEGLSPSYKVPSYIAKIIEAAPKRIGHSNPAINAVMVDVECLAGYATCTTFGPIDVLRAFTSIPLHALESLSAEDMDAIEKRLAEYESMGIIDRGAMIAAGDPNIRSVGRAMKSDDQVDALVRAFNHVHSETTMNESQKQAMNYGQNAVYGKHGSSVVRDVDERIEVGTRDELFAIARDYFGVLLRSDETDEELRVRLRLAREKVREDAARTPTKPLGSNAQCTIACAQCGHTNVYPLGETDPKESTCTHRFRFDHTKGRMGALICCACPLTIPREDLERLNIDPEKRYSRDGSALADVLTQLRQENLKVLAENAMLRRQLESLERKTKARR